MADTYKSYFSVGGLNLFTNPLAAQDGQMIRAVNVDSFPYGAKVKRAGYGTYLASLGTSPTNIFSWTKDNGTQFWTYASAGGTLLYSTQGTGAWTVCGNGTLTSGTPVGYTVLNNTLVISQGGGTTRHSTNGTSFTDTSGAPAGPTLEQFQNRVALGGTSNVVSFCVTGDPTNWASTGTSDGTTVTAPGAGLPNKLYKLADKLHISKNTQSILRWDGFNLVDLATSMGPSSALSYGSVEDNGFWLNRLGFVTSNGNPPQMISNPIQRQIYNDAGSGIQGATFGTAPGVVHRYDYLVSVGTVTDDFTNETIPNAITKYDYQKNEYLNYQFNDFPTAWSSYKDATGVQQLIFSNSGGQCFTYGGTALNDNSQPIQSIMEFIVHYDTPQFDKDWRWLWMFFNPGCEAHIQVAMSDTFVKGKKNWVDIGQALSGIVQYRFVQDFPNGARSKILYVKVTESSRNARFSYYGMALDAAIVNPG